VIGVAFISDRGDRYLPRCQETFEDYVVGSIGDVLRFTVIDDRDHKLGLAGAVNAAWDWGRDLDVDYLFHVEEDFEFVTPIDVPKMQTVLDRNPRLAQLVLKRQPWSPPEHAAGGIIEQNPDAYTDRTSQGIEWVEHTQIFSLNPCLIPRSTLERGWPGGNEAQFTTEAVADGLTFGFYGARTDTPRVIHVGIERGAGWRL
jgi:hypothetical protein